MRTLAFALLFALAGCTGAAPDASEAAGQAAPPASASPTGSEPVRDEPAQPPPGAPAAEPVRAGPVEPPLDAQASAPVRGQPVEPPSQTAPVPGDSQAVRGEPVEPPPATPPASKQSLTEDGIDYACRSDADCEVKNVGNCCGYYPACVNKDSPTFPDKVKAECAASGMSSICGFPEIAGCQCVEGRCAATSGAAGEIR